MSSIEYPFVGKFYRLSSDDNLAPDERQGEPTKVLLATVECDVQEDRLGASMGTLTFSHNVYFSNISTFLSEGDYFEADVYGRKVSGTVRFVFINELGTKVKLTDVTTNDR